MPGVNHITWTDLDKLGLPSETDAVVNLAGQNVLDPSRRWTPGFKQNVWSSRINTTSSLVKAISEANKKPEVFVNISGVSNYKPDEKKVYTEDDAGEDYDYMSKLCMEWEKAATISKDVAVRTVKIRTGVVLGREGGMIQSLFMPFFMGVGGPVASGTQPLPWIHIDDLCHLIKFSIENPKVEGVLNGVAPQIITNKEFAANFGKELWRPALIPLPEFVVDQLFGKERSVLLTTGAKVKPKRTLETGFQYEFPTIFPACKDCSSIFIQ
jgi:uncharacterized protein (TIGR01777 family)